MKCTIICCCGRLGYWLVSTRSFGKKIVFESISLSHLVSLIVKYAFCIVHNLLYYVHNKVKWMALKMKGIEFIVTAWISPWWTVVHILSPACHPFSICNSKCPYKVVESLFTCVYYKWSYEHKWIKYFHRLQPCVASSASSSQMTHVLF